MSDDNQKFQQDLLLAVKRAEQASIDASLAAKAAEKAAKKAKKAVKKVKQAKQKIKESEKEIVIMQKLAEKQTSQYKDDIIEIISKAKKKKKALKKIAKLNEGKSL